MTARETLELNAAQSGWTISRNIAEGTSTFARPLRTITVGFDPTGDQITSAIVSDGTFISATLAGVQFALDPQG